jgi:RecA-family ATPase
MSTDEHGPSGTASESSSEAIEPSSAASSGGKIERRNQRIDRILGQQDGDYYPPYGEDDPVEHMVAEMTEARLRELVRERFEAREHLADPAPPLDAGTLEELLGRPQGQPFRIEGLQPSQAAMLVVAQRKTGKTTFALNYARCLLTGEDFLGRFPVRAVTGSVAIINLEQSSEQLARWAHDHGIPRDRLYLANFRGTRNPLANLRDRKELVERLKEQGVESIIVDPFGRAFDGKDQNSSGEVSKWLADLDYFVRSEVGALDILLTAHSGWSQSGRARGSLLGDSLDDHVHGRWRPCR